ncbi:MAG: hypothetical protein ABI824_06080 [Acidobacteriota bacterium]
MRKTGATLRQASLRAGVSPRTVQRWAGDSLKRQDNGRYAISRKDRLVRELKLPTPTGTIDVAVRGSREASQIGKYWDTLQRYFRTGNKAGLEQFRGVHVTDVNGQQIPLLTDFEVLDRLGSAGVVSFESIYARVA